MIDTNHIFRTWDRFGVAARWVEVTMDEWDSLSEATREILVLKNKVTRIAFVKKIT